MDSSLTETNAEPQVVFRPSKKRKQFRQRAEDNNNNNNNNDDDETKADSTTATKAAQAATPAAAPAPDDSGAATRENGETSETEEGGLSVAEALRLRNARKSRLKGVEFRPETATTVVEQATHDEHGMGAPHKDDVAEAIELGVSRRFAPQAGLVGELVNKHMEEYIESELARRHAADKAAQDAAAAAAAAAASQSGPSSSAPRMTTLSGAAAKLGNRPTMSGRLHEVDLGEEVRMRNAAMTEQARRRLAGEALDDEAEGSSKRPRIGKDGKPWRPRKRRASEDIKRDQLVEELMRENRLDVYDVPAQPDASGDLGEDVAADERIAANFRREFMDAMAQRRQMRRRGASAASKAKSRPNPDEVLKGPKLGGSRNARAAMRDILLSQQQEKNKRR